MNKFKQLLILSTTIFFLSCEPRLQVQYYISNQSTNPIVFSIQNRFDATDSIPTKYQILPDQSQLIYTDLGIGVPSMVETLDSVLTSCLMQIDPDTLYGNLNLRDGSNWDYAKRSNNSVSFTLTIK